MFRMPKGSYLCRHYRLLHDCKDVRGHFTIPSVLGDKESPPGSRSEFLVPTRLEIPTRLTPIPILHPVDGTDIPFITGPPHVPLTVLGFPLVFAPMSFRETTPISPRGLPHEAQGFAVTPNRGIHTDPGGQYSPPPSRNRDMAATFAWCSGKIRPEESISMTPSDFRIRFSRHLLSIRLSQLMSVALSRLRYPLPCPQPRSTR